eukprot:5120890-Amphidinium_carterae.1
MHRFPFDRTGENAEGSKSQFHSAAVDESILADVLLTGEQGKVKEHLQEQQLKSAQAESVPHVKQAVSHWKSLQVGTRNAY